MINPAPDYPEVGEVLRRLLGGARGLLGPRFVGAYLFGSLACGDFDGASDVDVLVVTAEEVSPELFDALGSMHERLAASGSRWATQLEVSYVPRRALRRRDPRDATHPHIDRGAGERLRLAPHDSDWVVQRHTLRERGVTLAGPDPRALIDPVSAEDLRRAMLELLWWPEEILGDPGRIRARGYQSYIVLTMCRVLYTLERGEVASKREAARRAAELLGEPWAALIGRAWDGRRHPDAEAAREDVDATLGLIRETLRRARRFSAAHVRDSDG